MHQSLMFEKVTLVGVVPDQVLEGVELAAADVEVAADSRYSEGATMECTLKTCFMVTPIQRAGTKK